MRINLEMEITGILINTPFYQGRIRIRLRIKKLN